MRIARTVAVLTVLAASMNAAGAQTNSCAPYNQAAPTSTASVTYDACHKGADIFTMLVPQLGSGLAGGNTTPGQGGTLGGFPHFVIALRATGSPDAALPDFNAVTFNTGLLAGPAPAPSNIPIKKQAFGLAAVDAAVGIFGGINLGVGSIGGIDALVSASYIPEYTGSGITVKADSPLSLGFGARLGLFDGTAVLPSVGVSYLQRSMPKTTIIATAGSSGTVTIKDFDLKTTSWRITASQTLLILGLNAGYGEDTYDATTSFSAVVNAGAPLNSTVNLPSTSVSGKMTRTNWFVGATVNLLILKLFGEYGQLSGGNLATLNQFGGVNNAPNDNKTYYSAGVRIGF